MDVAECIGVKGFSSGVTKSIRVFSSDLLGHHSLSPLCTAVYKGNMKCCGIVLGLGLQFEIEICIKCLACWNARTMQEKGRWGARQQEKGRWGAGQQKRLVRSRGVI